jgi:hypothetical protein
MDEHGALMHSDSSDDAERQAPKYQFKNKANFFSIFLFFKISNFLN